MGGVEFEDLHFGSPNEFLQWAKRHHPGPLDYGLFVDGFSLLHGLNPGNVSQAEALKAEHDTKKVKYPSELAARVSTAFRTNFPDTFGTGGDPSGKSFGSAMSTHDKWHDPNLGTGLVVTIRERIVSEATAIANSINQELRDMPELLNLARTMLMTTRSFVLDLTRFVDDFYNEMNLAASMSETEAWVLTRTLLAEILKEIRKARGTVEHSRVKEPLLTIWGALKAHTVMKRYVEKEFRDDPALAGILNRYLIKRKTDLDGLDGLKTKLNLLTTRLTTLDSSFKSFQTEICKKKPDKQTS
jgi:hypothetical protein